MKNVTVTTQGRIRFLSTHPTLDRVARTLAQSAARSAMHFPETDIWIGSHRSKCVPRTPGRRLIILQTEQILDADGRQIWQKMSRRRILRQALGADLYVEWNLVNRPFYGPMPRLMPNRFLFGPYVFPDAPPERVPGQGCVFVGSLNARRREVLAAHPGIRIPPADATLPQIDQAISEAAALCNTHSLPGAYTEVPRVLMAVLAGKPLVSEALSAPFEPPAYLPLGTPLDSAATLDASFEALCRVGRRYPLSAALAKAHRQDHGTPDIKP